MASSANHSVAAVTPDPQLVMIGRSRSTPPAASCSDLLRQSSLPSRPIGRRHVEGPRHMARAHPGRGSGARPWKRSAGRASTTWAVLRPARAHVGTPRPPAALRALNWRGSRLTAPARAASAFHFGNPPSRMNTFSAPKMRNVHHTRGAPPSPRRHRPRWCRYRRCRARRLAGKLFGSGSMCGSGVE